MPNNTEIIQQLKEKVQEQQEFIEQMTQPPFIRGIVLDGASGPDMALVAADSKVVELTVPKKFTIGTQLRLNARTMGIIEAVENAPAVGEIHVVARVVSDAMVEIDIGGTPRLLLTASKLEAGDRVVVDPTHTAVIKTLGKETSRFTFEAETNVSWDDIGGLVNVKKQVIEAVELPHRHPDIYKAYNKKPIKGVLLYGPPGCGKTMIAKATATSLAKMHGKKASTGFIYVKGPEILDKWIGNSEATIRGLFEQARAHKKKNGYPAVLFIDEADAILGTRGEGRSGGSNMEKTIVPMFLAEMDGLHDSGALVLLATNRPDTLDPAIVREGRIDRKILVPRPNHDEAVDIFTKHLKDKPLLEESVEAFSKFCAGELFNTKRKLFEIVLKDNRVLPFTVGNMASGAIIAGMVDIATSHAMHRDLQSSAKKHGLTCKDAEHAADVLAHQNRNMDHKEDIKHFLESNNLTQRDVAGIR